MKHLFQPLFDWYSRSLETGGYPLVALLMAIESSIVPLPSELVIPPAAHLAQTGQIPFTVWGIVVAGTLGSWAGATLMYWASRWAGRPLVIRFGKYVFISPEKVEGAERWASKFGPMGIFISRLLPVVRHLIGIPAGIVRMDYFKFSIFTLAGSGIWCSVLAYVGVKMGQDEKVMAGEMHRISLWLGGLMLVIGGLYYFFVHRHMKGGTKAEWKPSAADVFIRGEVEGVMARTPNPAKLSISVEQLQEEANRFFARFTGSNAPNIDCRVEGGLKILSTLSDLERQIRSDAQTLSSMGTNLDVIVEDLYKLAQTHRPDRISSPEYTKEVRELGSLLGRVGGRHLMAAVGYRMVYRGCSEYSFSLAWDGVGGWMA